MVNKNQTSQLKCYVKEKEYITIQNNAKACDQKISAYLRESALNPKIINCTYDEVAAHAKELESYREKINRIAYTIYKTKEYVPTDIDYILEQMNKILQRQKEFIQLMSLVKEEKTRRVAKQARKIVRECLSETREQIDTSVFSMIRKKC